MELGPFSKLLLTGYYSKPYCLNIIFLKAQVVKGKKIQWQMKSSVVIFFQIFTLVTMNTVIRPISKQ